jgi:3-hydroxyacyl-[acyl-carrier-protein] dehydratase
MDGLYQVTIFDYDPDAGILNSGIKLNKEHPVFEGHFPGNPILPGVCTVQIVRELLSKALDVDLRLSKAGNIKYLGFVNPISNPDMQFQMTFKQATDPVAIICNVTVKSGDNTVCSFKGEYVQI